MRLAITRFWCLLTDLSQVLFGLANFILPLGKPGSVLGGPSFTYVCPWRPASRFYSLRHDALAVIPVCSGKMLETQPDTDIYLNAQSRGS